MQAFSQLNRMKNNCYNWGVPIGSYFDVTDKDASVQYYVQSFINRTLGMFKYDGLPDTIPQRDFELLLQVGGFACVAESSGKLYAFSGGLGGEPNEYYMPTICVVANPYLKLSKSFRIDEDCVVIPNDPLYDGLMPMLNRYASMLVENDITMRMCDINSRQTSLISASDDRTKISADLFIDNLVKGKFSTVGESEFFKGVKTQPYANGSAQCLTNEIEYHQYLISRVYNNIGLDMNYNMKRERLQNEEVKMNSDSLDTLPDIMLRFRRDGLEKVNRMFGTNITVDFDGAWLERRKRDEAEENVQSTEQNKEHENTEQGGDEDGEA